jgi:hypothetical protein
LADGAQRLVDARRTRRTQVAHAVKRSHQACRPEKAVSCYPPSRAGSHWSQRREAFGEPACGPASGPAAAPSPAARQRERRETKAALLANCSRTRYASERKGLAWAAKPCEAAAAAACRASESGRMVGVGRFGDGAHAHAAHRGDGERLRCRRRTVHGRGGGCAAPPPPRGEALRRASAQATRGVPSESVRGTSWTLACPRWCAIRNDGTGCVCAFFII